MTVEASLRARSLCVTHGSRAILDGLDLQVQTGTSLAVVGPSGVGKTTLLWCLAGLLAPREGTIELGSVRIAPASARERRRYRRQHVGLVLQGGELVPELTALENVVLGGLLAGLGAKEAESRGRDVMEALGLPEGLARQQASTLSGGERQRVAVARAVVHRPAVVLADEPTAALDAESLAATAELLAGLPAAAGCALVVTTHDLRVARRMDTILQLGAASEGA